MRLYGFEFKDQENITTITVATELNDRATCIDCSKVVGMIQTKNEKEKKDNKRKKAVMKELIKAIKKDRK